MKDVLLIEDDNVERQIICHALESFGEINPLTLAASAEALDFLSREGEGTDSQSPQLPVLIILDLHLGGSNGLALLKQLKGLPIIRRIPVIGVCTPFSQEIVNQAYDLNINCAIARRVQADDFSSSMQALLHFWLNINHPPVLTLHPSGKSLTEP